MVRKEKGLVIRYLAFICGISKVQTKRLISKAIGRLPGAPKTTRNQTSFKKKYLHLLAEFDDALNYPNGKALQCHLRRMFEVYKDQRFERLVNISHGHIYNLKKTNIYNYHRVCVFPSKEVLENDKVKIHYRREDYKTPYEKLKEVDPEGKCLREGITYNMLDVIHMRKTDFDYVKKMNEAYSKLRKKIVN